MSVSVQFVRCSVYSGVSVRFLSPSLRDGAVYAAQKPQGVQASSCTNISEAQPWP